MAKMTKEELKQKISDSLPDNQELAVELLEDIEDSMTDETTDNSEEVQALQTKYDDLLQKYKDRFLGKDDGDKKDDDDTEDEFLQEKDVIDVKEI